MNLTRLCRAVRGTLFVSLAALSLTGLVACTDTAAEPARTVEATAAQPATQTSAPTVARPGAAAPALDAMAAHLPADTALFFTVDVDSVIESLTPGGKPEHRTALKADLVEAIKSKLGVDAAGVTAVSVVAGKGWAAVVASGKVEVTGTETRDVAGLQVHTLPMGEASAFAQGDLTIFCEADKAEAIATAFAAPEKLAAAPQLAMLKKAADAASVADASMHGTLLLDSAALDDDASLPEKIEALDALAFAGGTQVKAVATGSTEAIAAAKAAWDDALTTELAEMEATYADRANAAFEDAVFATVGHHFVASLRKGYEPRFAGEMVTFEVNPGEIFGSGTMAVAPLLFAGWMMPKKVEEKAMPAVAVPTSDTAVPAPPADETTEPVEEEKAP